MSPNAPAVSNATLGPAPQDRVVLREVHKGFGSLKVLAGLNLEINEGEVVVIIGPSGSGKTTVLRCLAGLEQIQSGEIYVFGDRVTHAWKLKGEVGFVFQQFNLFPHMTALENVTEAPVHVLGLDRGEAKVRALEYLVMVGLEDKAHSYPAHLSGGQKQRVAIARALAMQPKIMLFDEITSALDPELVGGILELLRSLAARRTMTMVIVTHHMQFAESSSDRVVFFDGGVIVEEGCPADIFRSPRHARTRRFVESILETVR